MRASRRTALIGVAVHTDVTALHRTLDAINAGKGPDDVLVLVPDLPDAEVAAALANDARLAAIEQRPTIPGAAGNAAAYNRLAEDLAGCTAMVLLENGARPAPDALGLLVGAVDGEPGITGPSTNDAWNEQCVLRGDIGDEADLVRVAAALGGRYGTEPRQLGPLHSLAEVCIAVSAETIAATGAADDGFGIRPCWEMELTARAWRAGRPAAWVPAAFVYRAPPTVRRLRAEAGGFVAARRRYQDRMCGLRLDGRRDGWAEHCHGATCPHFAPPDRILVRLPLGNRQSDQLTVITTAVNRAQLMPTSDAAPPCTAVSVHPAEIGTAIAAPPSSLPLLVSCVMPTADRPGWAVQAIAAFARQTHPRTELVIVDDGDFALADVLGTQLDHPSIVYRREQVRRSIGAKRNIACAAASGDVVIHWDDDDWHAPDRIAYQLGPIAAGNADVTALRDAIWFDVERWRFRRPSPELHHRLFVEDVHSGTLAFRRTMWERGAHYPDTSLAEDAAALRLMVHRGARLVALPADGHYLYVRHGTNSWRLGAAHDRSGGWRDEDEPDWLADDRLFYEARSPAAPSGRSGDRNGGASRMSEPSGRSIARHGSHART